MAYSFLMIAEYEIKNSVSETFISIDIFIFWSGSVALIAQYCEEFINIVTKLMAFWGFTS